MIKNVGIIGGGTMGSGIAQVAATAGYMVTLFDVHQGALDTAKATLEKITNRLVEKKTHYPSRERCYPKQYTVCQYIKTIGQ